MKAFKFDLMFGWKGTIAFSSDMWEITTSTEKRLIFFYFGRSSPPECDVVVYTLIVMWFSFSLGHCKNV
jgi:hypothetical protein